MKNFKHILFLLFLLGCGTKIQAQKIIVGYYKTGAAEEGAIGLTKKIHKEIQVGIFIKIV